jgi:hypothetical protein
MPHVGARRVMVANDLGCHPGHHVLPRRAPSNLATRIGFSALISSEVVRPLAEILSPACFGRWYLVRA